MIGGPEDRVSDDSREEGTVNTSVATVDEVKHLIAELLGIGDRVDSMNASTELLGSLPELDSMAVIELVQAIEDRFGVAMDDEDISAETFSTLGSLAEYVRARKR